MRRSFALVAALLSLAPSAPLRAHDFWLEPDDFWLPVVNPSTWVRFRIGHSDVNEPWRLVLDRVVALRSAKDRITDQQSAIQPQTAESDGGARIALPPDEAGTHILMLESHNSVSDLPADRFDDYAAKEGLKAILAHRKALDLGGKSGREVYSRRAKALVQLGDVATENVTRPVGQTLEIVPARNPYLLKPGELLPVQVLYRGKPLPGALIDMRVLSPFSAELAARETDGDGRAVFTMPAGGKVKLNAVWGTPISGNAQADYETIFSSLTFGYPGAPRSTPRAELRNP